MKKSSKADAVMQRQRVAVQALPGAIVPKIQPGLAARTPAVAGARADTGTTILIDARLIKRRPQGNIRRTDPDHVIRLAEEKCRAPFHSPAVIDKGNHIIMGEQRTLADQLMCALHDLGSDSRIRERRVAEFEKLLATSVQIIVEDKPTQTSHKLEPELVDRLMHLSPADYMKHNPGGRVSVVQADVDITTPTGRREAFALEVKENELRRDFDYADFPYIVAAYKAVGYEIRHGGGHEAPSLIKGLMELTGKSRSTILRWLEMQEHPERGPSQRPVVEELQNIRNNLRGVRTRWEKLHTQLNPKGSATERAIIEAGRDMEKAIEAFNSAVETHAKKQS